jgi:hypothetical protein
MRVTAISNAFFARRAARLSTWIGLGLAFAAGMWSERTMAAATMCSSDSSTACWRQVTFVNFKDFAVGNGLVCSNRSGLSRGGA